MSTTDELLEEMLEDVEEYATPVADDDLQFWIDEHLRVISIPKNGVVAGVEGDKNVNKIKFGMNRYYHCFDMSTFSGRILYSNAKGNKNYYNITDMQASGNTITFSWLVDADAVQYMGKTAFVVYLFKTQGSELRQKFYSTLATLKVLEGMEVDSAVPVEKQTDIIERMKEEISAYAEEVKKSLPADYTAMTEQVSSLKEEKGNHDDNSIVLDGNTLGISEILSNEEIYNDFSCISSEDKVTMNYGEIDKSYGFLDIKNRKIRIFFLNTVDIPNSLPKYTQQHTKAIGQKQLDFVANNLHFNSNDWGVIFISHHCLYNNSGINPSNDKDTYVTDSHGGDAIKGIINAFKNRTSYSVNSTLENFGYSLNIDFTDNKSNEVICCINGHTHKDAHGITDNGILLISSQNAGIQDGEDENGNPVSKTKGTETETAIDIFTIDRKIKKVFATRYGAGKDREFNY